MRLILLETAIKEYGVTEIPGNKSNPEINKYFNITGHTWADDELAWCSAYVNWVCKSQGFEYSGKLNARSWLDVGENVTNTQVKPGDIVVFWRENITSWKGHVGFFIKWNKNGIYTLGGNQNNQVNIKSYPGHRLLGFRRLKFLTGIEEDNK